ncbi:MAG: hypothetical protein ABFD10_01935, partial [Prolixibacteraceae bacterium]
EIMKAKFYSKLIVPVLLGTIIGLNAEAQSRGNSANHHKKNEKAYRKTEKDNSKHNATAYRYDREDHGHSPYREYDYDRYGNGKKMYRRYGDDHEYPNKVYTYRHPTYGTVYRSFNTVPVRLRCHDGYYYFHGGHYYRLYPNVGYVRAEIPRSVVFYEIPSNVVRVRIGGHRYYRYGELVFERYDDGYRLAPPSVMININL